MRPFLLFFSALVGACASPLDLPAEPETTDAPHVATIQPDVAIASLGSPLLIQGTNLGKVTDVFLGPIHVHATSIQATDTAVVVHVTPAALAAANESDIDGDDELVKVVSPDGSDTALSPIRVYATLATIDEVTPVDLAAHQLVYLRGRGFDGENVDDNLVALARPEAADACGAADGALDSAGPSTCTKANVFWAAKGLVIAELPDGVPSGEVRLVYKNLEFEHLAAAAQSWLQSGRDLSGFYQGGDGGAPSVTGQDPDSAASAIGAAATVTTSGAGAPETAVVWDDPGFLTLTRRDADTVRVTGSGRLCYRLDDPTGGPTDRLSVVVDGAPMPNANLACVPSDDDSLDVTLTADVLATPAVKHSVQVVNPYFQSPVAFYTPSPSP